MNHSGFVDEVADVSGLSREEVEVVYASMRWVMVRALAEGDKVVLRNWGVFRPRVQGKRYDLRVKQVVEGDGFCTVVNFGGSRNLSRDVNLDVSVIEESVRGTLVGDREKVRRIRAYQVRWCQGREKKRRGAEWVVIVGQRVFVRLFMRL